MRIYGHIFSGYTDIGPFFTTVLLPVVSDFEKEFRKNLFSLIPQGTVSFYDSTHLNFTIMIYLRTYTDKMTH